MLKIKLFHITFFFLGTAFGQKDSTTTLSNSIGLSVISKFSMPTDFGIKEFVSSSNNSPKYGMVFNPKFSIQAGLSSRIILSKRRNIFLSLNLGYLNNGYVGKNVNTGIHLIDSEGNINLNQPSWADIDYISHYGFASLLLGKSLLNFCDNKFHLVGMVGIQGQYMFSSSFFVKHHSESNSQYDYRHTYKGSDITQNFVSTAVAELGLDIRIQSNFSLLTTLVCLYDLNSAKLSNNNKNGYYSFGLKLGILYNLEN